MLRRRRRDLEFKLDGVRGAVELDLHARWLAGADTAPDPRSESDVAYLRDRLETRQSARRLASQLDPLTALARSIRRTLSMQPGLARARRVPGRPRAGERVRRAREEARRVHRRSRAGVYRPVPALQLRRRRRLPRRRPALDLLTASDQHLGHHRRREQPVLDHAGHLRTATRRARAGSSNAPSVVGDHAAVGAVGDIPEAHRPERARASRPARTRPARAGSAA